MINILVTGSIMMNIFTTDINHDYLDSQIQIGVDNFKVEYDEYQKSHYFNGEHIDVIAAKLDKYLHSTLSGKGRFIAEYSLSVGMDPYLATAVMLQETGCQWTCSKLTRSCNNVGGNKGKPSCNGGSYRKFDTIEDGIKFAINKLNSYYSKGKTTPKQINPHYAEDKTWYKKVENYMKKLKE